MTWVVELETSSPDDGIQVQKTIEDSMLLLGADITIATADVNGWIVRFMIEASDPTEALCFASIRMTAAIELSHLPQWPVVAIRVLDAEYASASLRGSGSA